MRSLFKVFRNNTAKFCFATCQRSNNRELLGCLQQEFLQDCVFPWI